MAPKKLQEQKMSKVMMLVIYLAMMKVFEKLLRLMAMHLVNLTDMDSLMVSSAIELVTE